MDEWMVGWIIYARDEVVASFKSFFLQVCVGLHVHCGP